MVANLSGTPLGVSLACLAALNFAPNATAQVDLTVSEPQVIQVVPNVTLIAGKSTIVRSVIFVNGTLPGGTTVDGVMRVFVNGTEASFSPVYSENGPLAPPASPNPNNLNDTLNFVFQPPESNDVVLEVEINPAGPNQVAETNFNNNKTSTPQLDFICTDNPDLVYTPLNFNNNGGPQANLIEPGVGDNFIQGIFPSADWEYRLDSGGALNTSTSSSGTLLNQLASRRLQMNPRPDWVYGWWRGTYPGNGVATLNGTSALGNTQTVRHQRTFAHELGHLLGRGHINRTIGAVGVDVENHLRITENLGQIMVASKNDIMVAGQLTNTAWCWENNYEIYVNDPGFRCNNNDAGTGWHDLESEVLMVGGIWNQDARTVDLTHLVAFHGAPSSEFVPLSEANLVIRAFGENNEMLGEFGLNVQMVTDCGDDSCEEGECEEHEHGSTNDSNTPAEPTAPFMAALPTWVEPGSVTRLTITEKGAGDLVDVRRSETAPSVDLVSPTGVLGDSVSVEFKVSDSDTAQTLHYLRYSPDGRRMIPIASATSETKFDIDMTKMATFVEGKGYFEVLATDGLNTTSVRTTSLTSNDSGATTPPVTFILTPDSGKSFPFGATVILHASGWDEEDTFLTGGSIVWTSSIDGQIATGRITTVADLSVGVHTITVTATDSNGNTDTDSHTLTITARALPVFCQTDLGFGGPGSSLLQICGGDLSTGTTAEMALTNAAPNAALVALFSNANNPVNIFGGTIITNPVIVDVGDTTDGSGGWVLPGGLVGGNGPSTFYTQVAYLDGGAPFGIGISNAVQVDVLP